MSRRHKVKLNEKVKRIAKAIEEKATRIQKIEALQALGVAISRKADTTRVNKKMEGAIPQAVDFLKVAVQRRKAANRRKRNRRK